MLARIAGALGGDVLGALGVRSEDQLQQRADQHPLQHPVEHPATSCIGPETRAANHAGSGPTIHPSANAGACDRQAPEPDHPWRPRVVSPARRALLRRRQLRRGRDGQRVGVLLSHGFTGSPASMVPWGRHLAGLGYGVAVPRLPGHGTSWQELNRTPLGGLVRRGRPRLRQAARRLRPGRRRRAVDGWRSGPPAGRRPGPRRRRCGPGQPGGAHRAQGRPGAAGAQAPGRLVPRHRQRHQEGRASTSTATPARRSRRRTR